MFTVLQTKVAWITEEPRHEGYHYTGHCPDVPKAMVCLVHERVFDRAKSQGCILPLELASFPVESIVYGQFTGWEDGILTIDADELVDIVGVDPYIEKINIEIAKPGDSTRVINYRDIIEPKAKIDESAKTYPGIAGRSVNTVGNGRTHRLAGMTLTSCALSPEVRVDGSREMGDVRPYGFIDMSGPTAVTPYAGLINLCLEMSTGRDLDADTWNRALQAAMFRVSDKLAECTLNIDAPQIEKIDSDPKPGLPGFVFVPMLASPEHRMGATSSMGTAVYGVTRLTQPWFLGPTEMLDGAVAGTYGAGYVTWPLTNSIAMHMARNHGRKFNFLGSIVVRTNWESQADKQLMASRAAQLAQIIGATGAIVTTNVRGQRFAETILTVQALEQAGISVVLLTEEEDDENGNASPILIPVPELISVVSTGTGGTDYPSPPVDKVIGGFGDSRWFDEQPSVHGRYGISHTADVYGFTNRSCLDY